MTPRLARIRLYPVKSLDGVEVTRARVQPSGSLEHDRRWALFDAGGAPVNGKRHAVLHRLRAQFTLDEGRVHLAFEGESASFGLLEAPGPLERWLSDRLGLVVRLGRDDETGFPDDLRAPGPTVVSSASLEEVARWFPGLDLASARDRFRANLEIEGVPPFWEDRLFGPEGTTVPFRIGGATLAGTNPCARCAVPSRDPATGQPTPEFQRRFAAERRRTLPAWADPSRFDHSYRLAVNTRPIAAGEIRVGDPLALLAHDAARPG